jgi:hypothetical protein
MKVYFGTTLKNTLSALADIKNALFTFLAGWAQIAKFRLPKPSHF